MRIRTIKPGMARDEDLGGLSLESHFLFTLLPMLADKNGVLLDKPRTIKADLFPFRNVDVEKALNELCNPKNKNGKPFLYRYDVNGYPHIWIVEFTTHQRISGKEAENKALHSLPHNWEELKKQWGSNGSFTNVQEGKGMRKGKEGNGLGEKTPPVGLDEKEYKIRTPGQQVVAAYKLFTGVKIDDRAWDKVYYPRMKKYAEELLGLFGGNVDEVVRCIDAIKKWAEGRKPEALDWNLGTVVKRASDFKTGRLYEK